MLTQKQIDIIRSRDCTFSGELDELPDMAETLLAIEWAIDKMDTSYGVALAAYRDAQKIEGVE